MFLYLGRRKDSGITSAGSFGVSQDSSPLSKRSSLLQLTSFPRALPAEDVGMTGSSPSRVITALTFLTSITQLPLAFPSSSLSVFQPLIISVGLFSTLTKRTKCLLKALFSFKTNTSVPRLVQTGRVRRLSKKTQTQKDGSGFPGI